eukprot:7375940-Prymnesium_polylepis.3
MPLPRCLASSSAKNSTLRTRDRDTRALEAYASRRPSGPGYCAPLPAARLPFPSNRGAAAAVQASARGAAHPKPRS